MQVDFTIPGPPVGKGRPRSTKTGLHYTPKETVNYEALVKSCYLDAAVRSGCKYFNNVEMLYIHVDAYYETPKSMSKRDRERVANGMLYPVKKPDCDNILKIVCDALNGVAYRDDAQICLAKVAKYYTADDPHVYVYLGEIYT